MASHGTEPEQPYPSQPFSMELLADLHAGVLRESVSEELWPRVRRDPEAVRVLAALDAVTATLAASGNELARGEAMPPAVAERIDRALAAAENPVSSTAGPLEPPRDQTPVTPIASRRRVPRTVMVVGAAAAVAVVIGITTAVAFVSSSNDDAGSETVAQAPGLVVDPPPLVIDSNRLDSSLAYDVMANRGANELIDSVALPDCLQANGFDRFSVVLGSAAVELDGRSGIMLVIPRNGASSGLTLLAVEPTCGVDNPGTLVRRDVD